MAFNRSVKTSLIYLRHWCDWNKNYTELRFKNSGLWEEIVLSKFGMHGHI